MEDLTRRGLLRTGLGALGALAVPGCLKERPIPEGADDTATEGDDTAVEGDDTATTDDTGVADDTADDTAGDTETGDPRPEPRCAPTPSCTLGDHYLEGAPAQTDLTGGHGPPLVVTVEVTDALDGEALPDATVELWQATPDGVYDEGGEWAFRTTLQTDGGGRVVVTTLRPPGYGGSSGRPVPAHIHLRVTAADHRELVTRLYFGDDPELDPDHLECPEGLIVVPESSDQGERVTVALCLDFA